MSDGFGLWILSMFTIIVAAAWVTGAFADGPDGNIERQVIENINDERERMGLSPLQQRNDLSEMASAQAKHMANNGYYNHTRPDGTSISDRYKERGLLPECRLDIKGTNEYYAGAENILESGREPDQADEFADHAYRLWNESASHREVMMLGSAEGIGFGYATDGDMTLAVLEFC